MSPLWKSVWRFLKTLKIELPCDLAVPYLDIDTQSTANLSAVISTFMSIAALLTRASH